jgi:HAE1 family hydrophobic/amphiphilic exporter-1
MDRNDIEAHIRDNFPLPAGIICRSIARGTGGADTVISFDRIFGEDTSTLIDLAEEAVRRLRTIPGMLSVDTDSERGGQELRSHLDRDRSRRLGIDPRAGFHRHQQHHPRPRSRPHPVPDGRELRIFAQLGEADRTRIDDVRTMTFPPTAASTCRSNPSPTSRSWPRRSATSTARPARPSCGSPPAPPARTIACSSTAIDKAMEGFEMPRGYRWDKGSFFSQNSRDQQAMTFALTLAIIFVFLLMGSSSSPSSCPSPSSSPCRSPASACTGRSTSPTPGLDLMARRHRHSRRRRREQRHRARRHGQPAATEGKSALRGPDGRRPPPLPPDLMTTMTTVCGLIPMAVGNSKIVGMSYAPLGRTMIGGLLVSTLLTLLVVPLFYTLLDDLRAYAARVWHSAFHPDDKAAAPSGETAPAGGAAGTLGRARQAD